jgi:hypothetical protein
MAHMFTQEPGTGMNDFEVSRIQLFLLLLVLFLLSLLCLNSHGTADMDTFVVWTNNADSLGLVKGFAANHADYPPLADVILVEAVSMGQLIALPAVTSIKLSIILFLWLTTLACWLWTRDPLITLLMYLALFLNSALLAYVDIYFAPTLILALWALKERKSFLFTLCYVIACLTKWQPLIIAPIILIYILNVRQWSDWKYVDFRRIALRLILPAAGLVGIVLIIFGVRTILETITAITTQNLLLSGNALNANWILTHYLRAFSPERFGGLVNNQADYLYIGPSRIQVVPRLVFALVYLLILAVFVRQRKTFENMLVFSILGFLAYYTFSIGVHENHLFVVAVLGVFLLWVNRAHWPWVSILLLMNSINMFTFYGVNGDGPGFSRVLFGRVDIALLLAIFNVGFFFYICSRFVFSRDAGVHTTSVSGTPDPSSNYRPPG